MQKKIPFSIIVFSILSILSGSNSFAENSQCFSGSKEEIWLTDIFERESLKVLINSDCLIMHTKKYAVVRFYIGSDTSSDFLKLRVIPNQGSRLIYETIQDHLSNSNQEGNFLVSQGDAEGDKTTFITNRDALFFSTCINASCTVSGLEKSKDIRYDLLSVPKTHLLNNSKELESSILSFIQAIN